MEIQDAKVLIVDDEAVNRMIIKNALTSNGKYEIYEASNGKEAISILEDHKEIDIIILDILMPVMDGFDFMAYKQNRPDFKNIQVVIISALDDYDSIHKALKMGAYDYITKPLFEPMLQKILPVKIYNVVLHKKNLENLEKKKNQ